MKTILNDIFVKRNNIASLLYKNYFFFFSPIFFVVCYPFHWFFSFSLKVRVKMGSVGDSSRVLHIECGNMFDVKNIHTADIVMLETDIPPDLQADLCKLLG
jgi:hypothetical protein